MALVGFVVLVSNDLVRMYKSNLIVYASWGCAWPQGDYAKNVRENQLHSMSDPISPLALRRPMINTVNEHRSIL